MTGFRGLVGLLFVLACPVGFANEATLGPRLSQEDVRIPAGAYSIAATILRPQKTVDVPGAGLP